MSEELPVILERKNIKPTAMRLLVLDFLMDQPSAISLTDLEKGLEPCDRITVYRALKKFEESGLVHHIDDGTGITKYAFCKEECNPGQHHDLHVHFFCNTCKQTSCLPKTQIPQVSLPEGFHKEEVSLVVKGTCNLCYTLQ